MSNIERHSRAEVDKRVQECYKLRYESTPPIKQEKWVEYCHEVYNDRSEQQYCSYWASARDKYQESWKERLSKLLGPAVDELTRALASEDEKIRSRAIDQIMKYNGEDIQRIQADIKAEVKVNFTTDND